MSVSGREFFGWLSEVNLPTSAAELSTLTGIKRTTIHNQKIRGRISIQTVILSARVAGANPLDVLGKFEGYLSLIEDRKPVHTVELLSQVTHTDALVHLLSQIKADFAHRLAGVALSDIPHEFSVKAWIDAIDPGDLRRQIQEQTGIAASNLSAQITDNRLTPELAILISRICDVSSASGLVVSGLVTPAEAGWPLYGRENAMAELDDVELLDLTMARLSALRRTTKKKVDATAAANDYLETLG